MKCTVCCFKLLDLLQSTPGVTYSAQQIADELGVRKRPIGDYVSDLRDAEINIQSKRGRDGGYYIAAEDVQRPLRLQLAEFKKLTALYGYLEKEVNVPIAQNALLPLQKVIQYCASGLQAGKQTTHYLLNNQNSPLNEQEKRYLFEIDQAISNQQTIEFVYQSVAHSNINPKSIPPRKTDPYTLIYEKGEQPYFIGYDHMHKDFRVYKISAKRIHWLSGYKEKYEPIPGYSPKKILGKHGLIRSALVRYTIQVKADCARFFEEKFFGEDVKKEECTRPGWEQYSFTSDNPHDVFGKLYRMLDAIQLIAPEEAKEQYLKGLKDILESYSQNPDSHQ